MGLPFQFDNGEKTWGVFGLPTEISGAVQWHLIATPGAGVDVQILQADYRRLFFAVFFGSDPTIQVNTPYGSFIVNEPSFNGVKRYKYDDWGPFLGNTWIANHPAAGENLVICEFLWEPKRREKVKRNSVIPQALKARVENMVDAWLAENSMLREPVNGYHKDRS